MRSRWQYTLPFHNVGDCVLQEPIKSRAPQLHLEYRFYKQLGSSGEEKQQDTEGTVRCQSDVSGEKVEALRKTVFTRLHAFSPENDLETELILQLYTIIRLTSL